MTQMERLGSRFVYVKEGAIEKPKDVDILVLKWRKMHHAVSDKTSR